MWVNWLAKNAPDEDHALSVSASTVFNHLQLPLQLKEVNA